MFVVVSNKNLNLRDLLKSRIRTQVKNLAAWSVWLLGCRLLKLLRGNLVFFQACLNKISYPPRRAPQFGLSWKHTRLLLVHSWGRICKFTVDCQQTVSSTKQWHSTIFILTDMSSICSLLGASKRNSGKREQCCQFYSVPPPQKIMVPIPAHSGRSGPFRPKLTNSGQSSFFFFIFL